MITATFEVRPVLDLYKSQKLYIDNGTYKESFLEKTISLLELGKSSFLFHKMY